MPSKILQMASIMLQLYCSSFQTLYSAWHYQVIVLEIEVRGVLQSTHTGHKLMTGKIIELTILVLMTGLIVRLS